MKAKIIVTLYIKKCYRGTLHSRLQRKHAVSVSVSKCCLEQRRLDSPAKRLQWGRRSDRRRQSVPDTCSHHREGAVLCVEKWCEMDNWVTTPFSCCSGTAFLPVWTHCINARGNRCHEDLNSFPLEKWRPREALIICGYLSLNEATDVAQNRPLWRLTSTFGTAHSLWCMSAMNEWNTYDTVFHVMCTSFTPIFLYFTDLSAINGTVTDHEFLIRNEPVVE